MSTLDPAIEAAARRLYETSPNQCVPTWDQLGDVTKSVWREYVVPAISEDVDLFEGC